VFPITPDSDKWFAVIPKLSRLKERKGNMLCNQGTKNSFALPVELTAKFFGLQYRNRTDDIKITFIVAASALFVFDKANSLTHRGIFVHHPRSMHFTHLYDSVQQQAASGICWFLPILRWQLSWAIPVFVATSYVCINLVFVR
jgi:hypothetical protein